MMQFSQGNEASQSIHIGDSLQQLPLLTRKRAQLALIGAPDDPVWDSAHRIAGGNIKKALATYTILRGAIDGLATADAGSTIEKLQASADDTVHAANRLIDTINSQPLE